MKTKSMILLTTALCGFALAQAAITQPTGDASADPKATPVPDVLQKNTIVVIVLADGNVMMNGQTISLAELEQRLTKIIQETPNQAVRLRGDGDIPYQRMVAVIDVCQRAKAWNIAMGQTPGDAFAAPKAAEPRSKRTPDIKIQILRDGHVMVEGKTLTLADLETRLIEIRKTVSPPYAGIVSDGAASKQQVADVHQVLKKTGSELTTVWTASSDLLVRYEVFSIDPAKAAAMRREKPTDAKFHADLVVLVEKGEAAQESLMVIRCPSGQQAALESVTAEIYSTEYSRMPDAIPAGAQGEAAVMQPVPPLPTAFEQRNVGEQIEIEPTLGGSSQVIALRVMPTHTRLLGRTTWGTGTSATEMPDFEVQKLNTNVNVIEGQPFLLGTLDQPPGSKAPRERTWFAFATATFVNPLP